jgi:hypothetical protein
MGETQFLLSYRDGPYYYYLPTCRTPAKSWRGPFQNEQTLARAMRDELGDDVADTRTIVRPEFLNSKDSRPARRRPGATG